MPWRRTTRGHGLRVQRNDRRRCHRQLHHHAHLHGRRRCRKQQFGHPNHFGSGHHCTSVDRAGSYTTECLRDWSDLAEAIDACGPTSVSVDVETIRNASGNYTVIRMTATDDAGNSTSAQTITVVDTTPPA